MVVTGLVINWISDEITVSPPILLVLAAVALILLVAAERSTHVTFPVNGSNLAVAKLALLALLVGAVIGGVAVLPALDERSFAGLNGYSFHNYEVGAAVAVTVLASISALRRREPAQWLIFLAGSTAGMTLSIVYLKSGNSFVPTFVGWLVVSAFATTVVANGRELVRIFFQFLGFDQSPRCG